jgi:hypothetical protein
MSAAPAGGIDGRSALACVDRDPVEADPGHPDP